MKKYVPERGDLVWLNFNPQKGREQSGRRPALVLSPRAYNAKVGLAICCPLTSHIKGYPFEVELREAEGVDGVVLADQVRTVDWNARNAEFIEQATDQTVDEVLSKLGTLLR